MKFLLDACASSRSLESSLTEHGHDVVSARSLGPRATDEELLALAYREKRILVTEDKDFGELVFVQRLPHPCIVRFVEMRVAEKVAAMQRLIEHHGQAMGRGALIVVTTERIRLRQGPGTAEGQLQE